MVSCTEFIWAYSELFSFLDENFGKKELIKFWKYLSKNFLQNFEELVKRKGAYGMAEYWGHCLPEEGADYVMTVRKDFLQIKMLNCPSAELLRKGLAKPYQNYCEHCVWLYPPIVMKYGWKVKIDYTNYKDGICIGTYSKKSRNKKNTQSPFPYIPLNPKRH